MKIPDLRTGAGPELRDTSISIGDVVRAAAHLGRAFPIMYFPGPDTAPVRFVAVDCDRHFDAVPCECGDVPRIVYSTDRNGGMVNDGMAWLALSCERKECREKRGAITLFCGHKMFSSARGAMGSVARSWWNATRDRDGHPDDHGVHGGLLVGWEDFQRYMNPLAADAESEQPQQEET